ncbi:hypothetical protein QJR60_11420 [Paraclostridium sordellii]|uniref:hypothetical protein n=1 Tax=Paraclostridium sordellii TaxID=1505 RepID=UPI0028FDDA79|nr:hypothetical protein [Paeniclostridium sordellii]
MILTSIILGTAFILGTGLIVAYWNNLLDWVKRAIHKVKEVINQVVYGSKVFIKKMEEAIKEISKHYSQDELGRWKETIVSREIPASEVPAEIREKAVYMNQEVDITNELELKLS